VIPYWRAFLKKFPNPQSLAEAQEHKALKAWEGLGYYSRLRNLKKAAFQVSREGFPQNREGWQKLPGIGPYTSAALASIINKKRAAVVDGNVFRVLSRLYNETKPVDLGDSRVYFENLANPLICEQRPGDFNQALMELGATLCRPQQVNCSCCPWKNGCQGQKNWKELPVKEKKSKIHSLNVALGLVRRGDGRFLLDRRSDKVLMGGLWEFPGGKIEAGESAEKALHREIQGEVGLKIRIVAPLGKVTHHYTKFRVLLHPFLCEYVSGKAHPRDAAIAELRWTYPKNWRHLPMPAGSRKIINNLPENFIGIFRS
jgi:A/G-specific adenine glycosylase